MFDPRDLYWCNERETWRSKNRTRKTCSRQCAGKLRSAPGTRDKDNPPPPVIDADCPVCNKRYPSIPWMWIDGKKWRRCPSYKRVTCSRSCSAYMNWQKHRDTIPGTWRLSEDVYEEVVRFKLDSGCARCEYNKDHRALQFDHLVREDKQFMISQMMGRLSWEGRNGGTKAKRHVSEALYAKLWNEIRKCQVLCGNCHLIKTVEESDRMPDQAGREGLDMTTMGNRLTSRAVLTS